MKRMINNLIIITLVIASVQVLAEDYSTTDSLHLTLKSAKELATVNNKTILSAKEKLIERQAEIGIARSGFLPSISFEGGYTRLGKIPAFLMEVPEYTITPLMVYDFSGTPSGFTDPITVMTGVDSMELEMGENENYLLRGSIQQTLFTWGTLMNSYRMANINLNIEEENYRKTVDDVMLEVTQAYLGTYLSKEALKLMEESYNQMERHLNQVKRLYDNGMVPRLDLLRANVELSNLKTQVLRAERDMEIAFSSLKMLIGVYGDTHIILDVELDYEPFDITLNEALLTALERRPDLLAMRLSRDLAEKALAIERAQNKPILALIYNYDYKKPVSMASVDWGSDWNVTLALSMPIFQGGSYFSKVRKSKSQLKQLDFGLSQYEDVVKLDVKLNFLALRQELEILSYQKENVAQAEEALELAEEQYNNGMITNLEYMDTQLALIRSKLERLSSLVNYNIAKEKLLISIGAL
ncbi:TolC family protein [candidate division WOR-3 bacterium]|nr:TolC family protein [candidate division WOR-3 bacterium]